MAIHLVQFSPEIPQNTGNIMRTCVATGIKLHLIKPMGFGLDEKKIKRSGANYVSEVEYTIYENWEEFVEKNSKGHFYFCSRSGKKNYSEIDFTNKEVDYFIIIGPESASIPKEILDQNLDQCFHVPMADNVSALNISNIAAILAYEALRQQDFLDLWEVEPSKGSDWILLDE